MESGGGGGRGASEKGKDVSKGEEGGVIGWLLLRRWWWGWGGGGRGRGVVAGRR